MSNGEMNPDTIRVLAEQHGLKRALEKFPDGVKGAAERGLRPVGAMPAGNSPIINPAPVFNPEQYERGK
jgi:hypothetical protein